jgi:hypothetical protein
VDIFNNLIQSNLSNDDGGGLRFLMANNFAYNVYNNMIVNNISTHEGGGVALDDAPNVRFYNNTVMKNITTATAMTSNGLPAPAGLSTMKNSTLLQATLPGGSPLFSKPLLFNNIFWDNRAGSFGGGGVAGIGLVGDPNPINYWDMGVADASGTLSPTYTLMKTTLGTSPGAGNIVNVDPLVQTLYDTSVALMPFRTNPNLVGVYMVAMDVPPALMGDYHIQQGSPAQNTGVASAAYNGTTISAPGNDLDGQPRPQSNGYDMGADEWWPALVTADGGTITLGSGIFVAFPAGAFSRNVNLRFTLNWVLLPMAAGAPSLPPDSLLAFSLDPVYEDTGEPAVLEGGATYTLTLLYAQEAISATHGLREDKLRLSSWGGSTWLAEPSTRVDTAKNVVTASPDHYSQWVLSGTGSYLIYMPIMSKQ